MSLKKKIVDQNLNDQLRRLYKTIINLPENSNFLENRKICAHEFSKIFSNIKFILKGTENLPYDPMKATLYLYIITLIITKIIQYLMISKSPLIAILLVVLF